METSINSTVWFTLRTDKLRKDGKAPIWGFYSLEGDRVRFNTGEAIYPPYWNKEERQPFHLTISQAKGLLPQLKTDEFLTNSEIKEVKAILSSFETAIKKIETKFILNEVRFSANMVIEQLKTQNKNRKAKATKLNEPNGLVYDFIDKYVNDHKLIREVGSLKVYNTLKQHLKTFEDATSTKVKFENIDYNFFNKFQRFLLTKTITDKEGNQSPQLNNISIAKQLSTLKTFLGYAKKEGLTINLDYKDFKIKREKLEVTALTASELQSIIDLDLSKNKKLEKVRDIFVFSCATGLRYSDMSQLGREHIKNNIISITIKKTKDILTIPLNAISAPILDKYSDQFRPLPMISNQKLNAYIKELCKLAKIDEQKEIVRFHGAKRVVKIFPKYELIHIHTGRKTFCTLSLEKGMSAEEVMGISGHSDYRSFKRYVDVTEKRKQTVMTKAWGEVTNLKIVG